MTRPLSILILTLALAACAQAPTPVGAAPAAATSEPEPGRAMHQTQGQARLDGYHWQLQDAADAQGRRIDALLIRPDYPLQFDFVDGRIRITNACNGIGGEARIDGDTLQFGPLVSTKMACADAPVMALDSEVSARLQGRSTFRLTQGNPPQLVWTAANGDTLRFVGAPTSETRFGNAGETVFLEIAAHTKPCQHPMMPGLQRCLEVRERQYNAQGLAVGTPSEWRLFHDTIEGYTHEEGIRDVLRIKRFPIANPPMDAPAVAYVMEMTIESEMAGP